MCFAHLLLNGAIRAANCESSLWQHYEMANETEQSHLKKTPIEIIQEVPCSREKNDGSSRPSLSIHSKQKLDFACMMACNNTYRGIESDLRKMRTPSVLAPASPGSRNGDDDLAAPVAGTAAVAGAHLHLVLLSFLQV